MKLEFTMLDASFWNQAVNEDIPASAYKVLAQLLSLHRYNTTYLGEPYQLARKLKCTDKHLSRVLKPAIQAGFIKKHRHSYFLNPNMFWAGNNNEKRRVSILIWDNLGKTGLCKADTDLIKDETMEN